MVSVMVIGEACSTFQCSFTRSNCDWELHQNCHKMALYPAMMGQRMFADTVTVNGSCTHFVGQVSATPIIVVSIAVARRSM